MPAELENSPIFAETPKLYIITEDQLRKHETKLHEAGRIERGIEINEKITLEHVRITKDGKEQCEDNYINLCGNKERWFITGVFDGIGGEAGASVASTALKEKIRLAFANYEPDPNTDNLRVMIGMVEQAVQQAKQSVVQQGYTKGDSTISLSIGVLQRENGKLFYKIVSLNAGDSRGYVTVGEQVKQTTIDDNSPVRYKGEDAYNAFADNDKNGVTTTAFAPTNEFNTNTGYSEFNFAIGEVMTVTEKAQSICVYHMSDGVTDNLRDDPDQLHSLDLNILWSMEISRRLRGGISAADLALSAYSRIHSNMVMYFRSPDGAKSVPVDPKPDDIAVTKATIHSPKGLDFQKDEDFREEVLKSIEMKGILAYFVWKDFNQREGIVEANTPIVIRKFIKEYPHIVNFQSEIVEFLDLLSESKRAKYAQALKRFIDLAYGKSITQDLSWYAPYAKNGTENPATTPKPSPSGSANTTTY